MVRIRANAELPHQYNPQPGFVATANHKMIPDGYPYKVGYSWAPPYRFQRISQVLQQARSGDKLDVEALGRLQSDVLSLPALQFVDLLRAGAGLNRNPGSSRRSSAGVEVARSSVIRQRRRCTRFGFETSLRKRWISHYPQTAQIEDRRLVSSPGPEFS